jgi:hypothetical protein
VFMLSCQSVTSYQTKLPVNRKLSTTNVTCRRRASVNGCHTLLILIFLCKHIKILMSLPLVCDYGRTLAAFCCLVVWQLQSDSLVSCKLLVLSVMAVALPL